jgi:hypothetical protein
MKFPGEAAPHSCLEIRLIVVEEISNTSSFVKNEDEIPRRSSSPFVEIRLIRG